VRNVAPKKTIAVAAAALLVAGGGGAAIASSRADAPSRSSFLDSVARHLGVSRDELDAATKAAALEQVDAALAAGTITEAQADALRSRIEAGEGAPLVGPFFHAFHGGMHGPGAHLSTAAEYLGLTVEELRERLGRGQSLAEVAEAEGKSVDGLEEALVDQAEKRVDEAVEDGLLTDEQARAMLERLESRIEALVNGELRSHPRGGHRPLFGAG
jgi:hypothetical protein